MIQLRLKKNQTLRIRRRLKSKAIIRKKISGTKEKPRLVVFRSHKHIYAQLVNDQSQQTLMQTSTLKALSNGQKMTGCKKAEKVGENIAKIAKTKGIKKVVFDRNGYVYHGRIKAVAEGARKEGLLF